MATFDANQRKIVVRVVFDGPGFAGKTTNIRQLHGFFTERRRGELVVPEEAEGRTQFFDWMHLDGGLVQGYGLRCQLVSVPGQKSLSKRRWRLLRSADVVVFVCDSTEAGLQEAAAMYPLLCEYLDHRFDGDLPLVVQANKQDLPGALSAHAVRDSLGVHPEVPIVPATAEAAVGVRETAVLAIRAAANRVQSLVLARGLEGLSTDVETADEVLAELRELHGDGTAGVLTELGIEPSVAEVPAEPEPEVAPAPVLPPHAPEPADDFAPVTTSPTPRPIPPRPSPDVPSGFIWPAATGREVLRRVVQAGAPEHCVGLVARHGLAPGSGGSETLVYRAGDWCLKTSDRRSYEDADEGRAALLRLARRKVALAGLLPVDTVLSLAQGEGRCWLWTVAPWTPSLREDMQVAVEGCDADGLADALARYARAAVASARLALKRGLVLDVHPSNFAAVEGRTHYLDDDIDDGRALPSFGHAILQRVLEYEAHPDAIGTFLDALFEAMATGLSADDVAALELASSFEGFSPRSGATSVARQRIVEFLHGYRRLVREQVR